LKTITLFLFLVFAADVFAQQPGPPQVTPGIPPHYGSVISDTTLIVTQGWYARFHITWWIYEKEEEMPFENYTVEIVYIRNEKGEEIPMPKGMEFTYYVTRDPEKEPPYERKAPYKTYIHVRINTSTDTPPGAYRFSLRSNGYGTKDTTVRLVVLDKENKL